MSTKLETEQHTDGPRNVTVRLTSAEIANLWTQYINDSMAICFITHSVERVQDQEIRSVLEYALGLARTHVDKVRAFMVEEGFALPVGFTEEDIINPEAPPLFSDEFLLNYFYVMTLLGLTSYAGALSTSTRSDQRRYFTACSTETMELFNKIIDAMLEKGLYVRPPHIPGSDQVDFVEKQGYLAGWLGKQRPLNAIEISSIFFNMIKIDVKIVLEMAFSQVAQSPDIRKYLSRGIELCQQHFMSLSKELSENDLPQPRKWESEITDSTSPPFSDKLMLFHIVALISASAAFYGAGLSVSQRRDLGVKYTKLIADMGLYAEDGVNLLINRGWLEEPPGASDREGLLKQR
ncbi:DUF3231 family protein [Paenibacillus tarimensis]|uniref:DUF3231 family protein n=1 Tax=Paenibacillus tarimensis TaxID=416012 RepID=UPI001F32A49C|nr:DUF3231 family protein [Paenibacillus tarimensis]MCF2944410.1 DUF3231 family protein [Paenibacillus tarimensis]